jgi:hypothetical protein
VSLAAFGKMPRKATFLGTFVALDPDEQKSYF